MKLQVFGARGMLGSAVVRAAEARGYIVNDDHVDLEIVGTGHIRAETVINCAGLVKERAFKPSRFMAVNAVGPQMLAEACDRVGARMIQVSTDCVFSGPRPHSEWDAPDDDDDYARSKLAGEVYRAPHLTVRTSFVGFGERGLLARLIKHETEYASRRLLWSGHTADTIADVLITLAARAELFGLLHIPGEFQSRYELCRALVRRYDLPTRIIRDDEYQADRRLISHKWYDWRLPDLPPFAAQLEAMRHG